MVFTSYKTNKVKQGAVNSTYVMCAKNIHKLMMPLAFQLLNTVRS